MKFLVKCSVTFLMDICVLLLAGRLSGLLRHSVVVMWGSLCRSALCAGLADRTNLINL